MKRQISLQPFEKKKKTMDLILETCPLTKGTLIYNIFNIKLIEFSKINGGKKFSHKVNLIGVKSKVCLNFSMAKQRKMTGPRRPVHLNGAPSLLLFLTIMDRSRCI